MTRAETAEVEVQALTSLDLEGLRAAWRRRYGAPPKLRSVEILRLMLGWRIQAEVFGGLDTPTRRRLRQGVALGVSDHVGQGVRISKEWRGETFVIERVEGGYRWRDKTYPSLTSVAFAITGIKRNGPQFFGLRDSVASS
jgi:hypothetical protein